MTAATFPPATTAPSPQGRRMWTVGAVAGVASSLVVIALVAIAEAAGVPMEVAENSTKQPEHIPLLGYAMVILGSTLVGLLLASAAGRWAGRPRPHVRDRRTGADRGVVRLPRDDHGDSGHQGGARDHPHHPGRADHPGDRREPAVAEGTRHRRADLAPEIARGPRHNGAGPAPGPLAAPPGTRSARRWASIR